ncbi:MAG: FAD-binding oxidoreductase, partial [Kiloniellales bacterium]|nr:FAD-binding oxidoreductase [Kiloniellales bacterium]
VKALIDRHEIDCDWKEGHISAAWKARDVDYYRRYVETLRQECDYPHVDFLGVEKIREEIGSKAYHGGALDRKAAHLHPLNYSLGLARAAEAAGARLYEQSKVLGFSSGAPGRVRTAEGEVTCRYVVLACNGYLGDLEPRVAKNIMPINNFIIATEPLGEDRARSLIRNDVAVSDSKYVVDYYRLSADRRLLFGGGETYGPKFPADIGNFVRKPMLRVFPQLADVKIDYAWGGTLAITMTRLPDVGRLEGDVYYAHGFSGQGVALTSLAGKLMAEAISGTAERFDVFSRIPTKPLPGGTLLRRPGLIAAMLYYSLLDKL